MCINQIIELTKTLDSERFEEVFSGVQQQCKPYFEREDTYIDQSLSDSGIVVQYRDSTYKKKIIITINAGMLMGDSKPCADKLLLKISRVFNNYFDSEFIIDDFNLSKVCFVKDLHVGDRDDVAAYLKVMKRVGKVKGFSPVDFEFLDNTDSFCLSGNSNGIDFLMYDLEQVTVDQSNEANEKILKYAKGILRTEVQLTTLTAVRKCTKGPNTFQQIAALYKNREGAFLETFARIVPFGDFYKKGKAIDIIQREVGDPVMCRKMLRLVELIPEKKSLWLAQKAASFRDMDKVMRAFAKIALSPVTIGKRHEVKHLRSLYSFL